MDRGLEQLTSGGQESGGGLRPFVEVFRAEMGFFAAG